MAKITTSTVPSLQNYKLFIFDLDGTLYDQNKLRLKIMLALFLRLLLFKISFKDLLIISTFRKEREKHKGYSSATLATDQFIWCADKLGLSVDRVKYVIEEFMYKLPLLYLKSTLYKDVVDFLKIIHRKGHKIAIYSDYPVDEKLEAFDIVVDETFCSTDKNINSLKPNKDSLLSICLFFDCKPGEAIYFGDRDDTDGESARMANIGFIHVSTFNARRGKFYAEYINKI